jgi:hypothetical protein
LGVNIRHGRLVYPKCLSIMAYSPATDQPHL